MTFATVRDLKNRTSEMLRKAGRGKDVLITNHGRPVAVLHGLGEGILWKRPGGAVCRGGLSKGFRTAERRDPIEEGVIARIEFVSAEEEDRGEGDIAPGGREEGRVAPHLRGERHFRPHRVKEHADESVVFPGPPSDIIQPSESLRRLFRRGWNPRGPCHLS